MHVVLVCVRDVGAVLFLCWAIVINGNQHQSCIVLSSVGGVCRPRAVACVVNFQPEHKKTNLHAKSAALLQHKPVRLLGTKE